MIFVFTLDDKHYSRLADNFDKFYSVYHTATVNVIKHYVPLSKDDQIVDIGAGTGELALRIAKEFAIQLPPICVDPNKKMLEVAANKGGLVPVLSTAEEFLAKSQALPMKLVILTGVVHYINDLPDTLEKIGECIKPVDGTCIITLYPCSEEVWFKKVMDTCPAKAGHEIAGICDSLGLHCKEFQWKELAEVTKEVWYESLRERHISFLKRFNDNEIEEGICELEKKHENTDILQFNVCVKVWLIKNI